MVEKTIEILSKHVKEGIEIKPESALVADLGLTSLDIVDIIVSFEDEFDMEIPDQIIPSLSTVQDIANYLEKHA
ncbi:MAG: acyl carrier protein [Clostridia bacterium]|nr:acyl carrier protein [Clostridia bacterium]